jgi:site-specific DNA-methyltransferase (adenine-specific)
VEPTDRIGGCDLYLGDCVDVLPEIGRSPRYVVTDPPYGVTYQSNRTVGRGVKPITNDGTRISLRLYRKVIPLLDAAHVLWFTRWDAWPDVWEILGQNYPLKGLLVWDKGSPGMGDLKHWGPSYELIATAGTGDTNGSRDGSVLRYNTVPPDNRHHPTEKPVALLRYLIAKITNPGDVILDPFMGSGTTGVAAMTEGRKFVGVECDPVHYATAKRRILAGTGGGPGQLFAAGSLFDGEG